MPIFMALIPKIIYLQTFLFLQIIHSDNQIYKKIIKFIKKFIQNIV